MGGSVFAEENSGWYATGSIGASQISDIKNSSAQKIKYDAGLGIDFGFGYDFGSTRLEGTWTKGQSPGFKVGGFVGNNDTKIESLHVTGYYDFRSSKKWSPFVGGSLGYTSIEYVSIDSGFSWGLALGLSYKTSDKTEVFFKSTRVVTPEFDGIGITDGTFGNGIVGVKFLF